MSDIFYSAVTLLVVYTIYRPFISRLDILKYVVIGGVTLLFPYQYNSESAIASTQSKNNDTSFHTLQQLTPLLEATQTHILTNSIALLALSTSVVSLSGLFSRWQFPITFINPNANIYLSGILRHGISLLYIYLAISQTSSHSLALNLLGLFWYVAGPYFLRRYKAILSTIVISTGIAALVFFTKTYSFLDLFSDCFFFSCVIVLACHMFDYLDAILNIYPHMVTSDPYHVQNPLSVQYWYCMARLLCKMPSETDLDPLAIQDLNIAIKFLGPGSRSWKTMSSLFPVNLRQDLCLLYAFFRTADDLIDDASTREESEKNLLIIRRFLRDVFLSSKPLDWSYYLSVLPSEDHVAIFRNFTRISHYLCPRAMSELTDAWELDLRGNPVKKQKDLLNYAAYISGTFGELCTCVIMYKTGHGNWGPKDSPARNEQVLLRARATGQCLQLVNIARDIIADSLDGRCYVPLQYMPYPSQRIYHLLKVARTPMEVGENQLKSFALRILSLADRVSEKAQKGIDGLPDEVQDSFRATFEIYMEIGPTLRNDPGFPLRAKVPKRVQQWIAFRSIYGFRGPVARAVTRTLDEVVSLYTHAFARISGVRKGPMAH